MDQPWKMLVYISADNTLYDDALVSLRQLTDASSLNNVDIVVQLDGPSPGQGSRYRCVGGKKQLVWEADKNYVNINRAQRLKDFLSLEEAAGKLPTAMPHVSTATPEGSTATPPERQRIALILWGHGAGLDHLYFYKNPLPKDSLSPNVPNPNLYVTNIELGTILEKYSAGVVRKGILENYSKDEILENYSKKCSREKILEKYSKEDLLKKYSEEEILEKYSKEDLLKNYPKAVDFKIDLLGFDSCLMAMTEICHEVAGSVSLVVASDEVVPDQSWPYDTILGDLSKFPGMDANTLSAAIISRFRERYTQKGSKTRVSLSSMNLSKSSDLVKAMTELVNALDAATKWDADVKAKSMIFRARDASRTPDEVTYIDFGVFCKELSQSFSQEHVEEPERNKNYAAVSNQAKNALDVLVSSPYILYHRDAGEDGSIDPYGLAIYFPQTLDIITSLIDDAVKQEVVPKVMPRDDVKTPGTPHKTPGTPHKGDGPQITGYEILWGDYLKLKFNQDTRWANLVCQLLGGNADLMSRTIADLMSRTIEVAQPAERSVA
ncbi:hypothetical protein H7849_22250 [Alloacidobacterium dinghuense]|uniref:Clostripain n=1 Tax=Alloacidobacterium dinghuense TaxID=2763107 RepID=A0A7G8BGR9_9BACT|nr:clostripain-related cysteine peptidase [Alloacidobacterium dinghuense]QNI31739.1 hypothetical protein H7849_22250 [Alloacidobacterium dinghuense]